MNELNQITVIGLGLLGGSISLTVLRSMPTVKVVGYSHRAVTRRKARKLAVANEIAESLTESVSDADLVILASPICTFEELFKQIGRAAPRGCIVTDVGSTKVLPQRWASKQLPQTMHYVGSHPIAGSEQRGVEFARDDLLDSAMCIVTKTHNTSVGALQTIKKFWSQLGCSVELMTPAEHDRIFANVSHLPHIVAAALVNASRPEELKFAGSGFIDTSRIASGPANIWSDVLLTNSKNTCKSIDKIIVELEKLKKAVTSRNKRQINNLLESARSKRSALIDYKIKKRELIS